MEFRINSLFGISEYDCVDSGVKIESGLNANGNNHLFFTYHHKDPLSISLQREPHANEWFIEFVQCGSETACNVSVSKIDEIIDGLNAIKNRYNEIVHKEQEWKVGRME